MGGQFSNKINCPKPCKDHSYIHQSNVQKIFCLVLVPLTVSQKASSKNVGMAWHNYFSSDLTLQLPPSLPFASFLAPASQPESLFAAGAASTRAGFF